jgi:hypothetical protein
MKPTVNLNDFLFTQNNLQTYLDCPRQFELRYLLKQECPPISTTAQATSRKFTALGSQFHQLVHRHFIGLPIDEYIDQQVDPQVLAWWKQFTSSNPLPLNLSLKLPELSLTCSIENARLLAKLDLLVATSDQKLIIFDWKTSPHLQSAENLRTRVQTRLYPFVVSKVGHFGDTTYLPDQVMMVYWFANHPEHPVLIPYSSQQQQVDQSYLSNLIREIRSLPIGEFQKTSLRQRCDYCDFFLICHKQKAPPSQTSPEMDVDLFPQPASGTIPDEEIAYRYD